MITVRCRVPEFDVALVIEMPIAPQIGMSLRLPLFETGTNHNFRVEEMAWDPEEEPSVMVYVSFEPYTIDPQAKKEDYLRSGWEAY